ncbi:MazG nucleotide pyrophosphohydrolase domain-containing protein [Epibacterium ulvae]|uniref:MazG nucleotide pyrophosphohydrolase domain-containing protein n=1 Tax=Epibacterium ulvae TaxID=1156985 RepID=UPI002490410E|nr:MazG nucleotide pyrophosphohydrolase domain-containing protein [Epibacterium ulvae]
MSELKELSDLSQQVSDLYAARFGIERDATWHLAKLTEELGELQAAYLKMAGQARTTSCPADLRRAMEDEAADVFAQLLLFADWQEIDLKEALRQKWAPYLE